MRRAVRRRRRPGHRPAARSEAEHGPLGENRPALRIDGVVEDVDVAAAAVRFVLQGPPAPLARQVADGGHAAGQLARHPLERSGQPAHDLLGAVEALAWPPGGGDPVTSAVLRQEDAVQERPLGVATDRDAAAVLGEQAHAARGRAQAQDDDERKPPLR